jgi:hypothetical protein
MPKPPPEVLSGNKPSVKQESSELKGIKAVIYVGVMILTYVCFAVYTSQMGNRNVAQVNESMFKALLSTAVVAWIISKFLPGGWLTTWRTLLAAVVINGGIALGILYAVHA